MLRTNITTIAKAVQYHSLEKVIKHVEFIKTIELNCWHFFFSFAFATEMAMHWMKLVSTMITFVNPVSFVPWATLKKSEKQSRNWISSKWRQNGLIQHLREKFLCLCTSPPVPSLGLVVFVILFLEDKDFMVTKMWLLKMNPTFYYKLWTKRTRKLCDNISKDRSIKHKF